MAILLNHEASHLLVNCTFWTNKRTILSYPHHDVQVCSSTSADTSPHHDGASTIAVMFRDVGILKSLPTSSPHSSTSICEVKTVQILIAEEYRIPIVISPVDVILCQVQTCLFVKSGQWNANVCSPR